MSRELDEEVDNMCDISNMYIERGLKRGIQQGIQQGMEQGLAQGLARGISKGAAQEKITMIKEMHKSGIPIETIAKVARISVREASKHIEDHS